MTNFPRKIFHSQKIKLNNIYKNIDSNYNNTILDSKKIKDIYGDLLFKDSPKDRPFLYSSFVSSIDGKINFNDQPNGTLIAKNNIKDINGGLADFWIMNMLRSISDAVIIGSGTLRDEPNITAHIFDKDLENDRIKSNKPKIPLNIIVSQKAKTIPYDHYIFRSGVPLMLITSNEGARYAKYYSVLKVCEITGLSDITDVERESEKIINLYQENQDKLIILNTGIEKIDNKIAMKILKILGINYASVEASYYTHTLIKEKMLDEIFLNYSGIYIGGKARGIAYQDESFSSLNFPHMEMLSIHNHSPFFMYTRQRFIYD